VAVAVPAGAQVRVETGAAANAGATASASAASVTSIPAAFSAPALTSVGVAPLGAASAGPASAPLAAAAASPAVALAPSAVSVIDPASLPAVAKHYDGAGWAKLTASAPDEGARAVLRTMNAGTNPQLDVKLADGRTVSGSFLGMAGDKIAFKSGGQLMGLDMNTRDIVEVKRHADVWFDGGSMRPEEVVVHQKPAPVADPFKDMAAYKGRYVEMDIRDLDDLKWSAQTVSGKVIKADGQEIQLESPKGQWTIQKEFHRIDAVRARVAHYDSKGDVNTLSDVNGRIQPGTPVEVAVLHKSPVKGLFRGVRSDKDGSYVLLETPNSDGTLTLRGYRDALSVRTQDYKAGELMADASAVYTAPDAPK
jgi:hypothetical protein